MLFFRAHKLVSGLRLQHIPRAATTRVVVGESRLCLSVVCARTKSVDEHCNGLQRKKKRQQILNEATRMHRVCSQSLRQHLNQTSRKLLFSTEYKNEQHVYNASFQMHRYPNISKWSHIFMDTLFGYDVRNGFNDRPTGPTAIVKVFQWFSFGASLCVLVCHLRSHWMRIVPDARTRLHVTI